MADEHRIIDAHQHLWTIGEGRYAWITPDLRPLREDFGPEQAEPLAAAAGIDQVILVQAEDSFADTEDMIGAADRWDRVAGIVAWLPLDDPQQRSRALGRYREEPRIVGIRALIHDRDDADWVVQPAVLDGLRELRAEGMTFDVVTSLPRHLEHVPTIAEAVPGLRLVLDHLGKPPSAAADPEGFTVWRDALVEAASHEQVSAKLSGLDTTIGPGYGAADLRAVVETALECFGPSRLMAGSDWPVSLLADGYARWWEVLRELLSTLSDAEKRQILGDTAARIYGIPD